jgi:hypothetical protein
MNESEKLDAQLTKLEKQHEAIKAVKREISSRLSMLHAQAEAERKLAAMSDTEKAALAQLLGAEGIAPGSGVGTPGAG